MRVGIYLTNQQPPGADMVSALEEQLVMVRAARDRGWDAVGTGQHYLTEPISSRSIGSTCGRGRLDEPMGTGIPV